jgi:integrase
MPRYSKDVSHIITQEEVRHMLTRARSPRDRVLIILLYLLGPRPIELVSLQKRDLMVDKHNVDFRLPNSKIKNPQTFHFADRHVIYPTDQTVFLEEVLDYWRGLKAPESWFFPNGRGFFITPIRVRQIIYHVSNNQLFPYNNRHTRTVLWDRAGLSISTIMAFRGTRDLRSLSHYLGGKAPKPPERVD